MLYTIRRKPIKSIELENVSFGYAISLEVLNNMDSQYVKKVPRNLIEFFINKDIVTVMLDTSGAPLHKRGYRLTIATSRLTDSLLLFMRHHNIDGYFEYVVGADSVENHKPHPEPVLKTLTALSIEPSDALVVGDMPVDIAMAHNAKVRAVGVSYGNASYQELETAVILEGYVAIVCF